MPLANLCSQLVVTRTRRNTSIPGSRLAPLARRSCLALRFGRNPEPPCLAIHGDVGTPQATRPTLSSGAIGVAPLAAVDIIAPKGGLVSQVIGSCGPCQPLTRPVSRRTGDSCRVPLPRQHPGSVTNRPSSSCVPPTKATRGWRARVAFHRQVLSAPVSACASTAASRPPPVLWRCRQGLASDTLSRPVPRALDLGCRLAFARATRPRAACRLLQRSVPRAHLRPSQPPPAITAFGRCSGERRRL